MCFRVRLEVYVCKNPAKVGVPWRTGKVKGEHMKLTDKILKMKQDVSDFDREVLTKLREIHETVSVVKDKYLYDEGHIISMDIIDDELRLCVVYDTHFYDGLEDEYLDVPLRYFDMTKEELVEEKLVLEKAREEQNRQRIIGMYKKKLSEIENMKDQLNVLKAEIVATQEEAEELKRLSEKE